MTYGWVSSCKIIHLSDVDDLIACGAAFASRMPDEGFAPACGGAILSALIYPLVYIFTAGSCSLAKGQCVFL